LSRGGLFSKMVRCGPWLSTQGPYYRLASSNFGGWLFYFVIPPGLHLAGRVIDAGPSTRPYLSVAQGSKEWFLDDEHRKPLPREAFLMRLLHFKSLDELQKWMSEPTSPQ